MLASWRTCNLPRLGGAKPTRRGRIIAPAAWLA